MSLQSINLYNLLAKKKLFKKKVNFSLKRIKEALIKLNNPEKKLNKVVNIIGSTENILFHLFKIFYRGRWT